MTADSLAQVLAVITSILRRRHLGARRHAPPGSPGAILMQTAIVGGRLLVTGGVHAVPLSGILLLPWFWSSTGSALPTAFGASRSSTCSPSARCLAQPSRLFSGEQTLLIILAPSWLWLACAGLPRPERVAGFRRWHLLRPSAPHCSRHECRFGADDGARAVIFSAPRFGGFLIYLALSPSSQRLVWNPQALWPLTTGRNLSILCIITAISLGRVNARDVAQAILVWSLTRGIFCATRSIGKWFGLSVCGGKF
jgi:hypothetical protein